MITREHLSNDGFKTLSNNIATHSYVCRHCGKKEIIRYNYNRVICSHCHHWVYKSPEIEKQYKFKEKMYAIMRERKTKERVNNE